MIVSVIALSIIGYFSFNYSDDIIKQKVGDQLIGESEIRGETIRLIFQSRIEQNNILANDPMINSLILKMNGVPTKDLQQFKEMFRRDYLIQIQAFQELVGFSVGFEDTKIIGKNGKVFFSLSGISDENYSKNHLFQRGLKESFIEFESTGTGKKMIVVSPVYLTNNKIGDEAIGVIISKMRTNTITTNRSGLGETGEVYFVNTDFQMLSESRLTKDTIFNQKVMTKPVDECFTNNQNMIGIYENYKDKKIYGSSYCAKDLGIILLVEMDLQEIEEPIKILQNRIILTGIIITGIMGVIAYLMSKNLSRPLIKLRNAANKIANGDFDVRTDIKTRDEIGELSLAFDSMASKLQESIIEIKQKEDVIKQQEDILLQFSDKSEKYCVCMIDIMNSTKIISMMQDEKINEFYKIFINSTASIVNKFDGYVVKNIGDALLFYFSMENSNEREMFKKCLDCCIALSESHKFIVEKLQKEELPIINYRISATFGLVRIAKSSTSSTQDIFGDTVNRCAKINRSAPPNGFVVGEDFYSNSKKYGWYHFKKIENDLGSEQFGYNCYEVTRNVP
jgi:HAMP domain-containing protein